MPSMAGGYAARLVSVCLCDGIQALSHIPTLSDFFSFFYENICTAHFFSCTLQHDSNI